MSESCRYLPQSLQCDFYSVSTEFFIYFLYLRSIYVAKYNEKMCVFKTKTFSFFIL